MTFIVPHLPIQNHHKHHTYLQTEDEGSSTPRYTKEIELRKQRSSLLVLVDSWNDSFEIHVTARLRQPLTQHAISILRMIEFDKHHFQSPEHYFWSTRFFPFQDINIIEFKIRLYRDLSDCKYHISSPPPKNNILLDINLL